MGVRVAGAGERHYLESLVPAIDARLDARKLLLGHKDGDITTHYFAPGVKELIDAVDLLAEGSARKCPNITLLHVRPKGKGA